MSVLIEQISALQSIQTGHTKEHIISSKTLVHQSDNNSKPWAVIPPSNMANNTVNQVRRVVDGMPLTTNQEKELISLSLGDPTVFGNLPPDEVIEESVIASLRSRKRNGYAPSIGYEDARAAVAEHYTTQEAPLTAKDIILTNGCSGAIDLAISVLADPGKNILVPKPGFPLYGALARSLGIQVRYYKLDPKRAWEIDLDDLESSVDDNTACLVVNNPSNPCGSVYSQKHIRQILALANRLKLPIIADEVYADFVFHGQQFVPMATQTNSVPILTCGGLTKKYLVPGWRMGWIMIHDRQEAFQQVRHGLVALSQRLLGPNTIIQGALKNILENTPKEFFDKTICLVQKNAEIVHDVVSQIKGLTSIMPAGAMYMMIGIEMAEFPEFHSDVDFTQRLANEQSVLCLPAQCFECPNHFRVVLTVPEAKIRESCARIKQFCAAHHKTTDMAETTTATTTTTTTTITAPAC